MASKESVTAVEATAVVMVAEVTAMVTVVVATAVTKVAAVMATARVVALPVGRAATATASEVKGVEAGRAQARAVTVEEVAQARGAVD